MTKQKTVKKTRKVKRRVIDVTRHGALKPIKIKSVSFRGMLMIGKYQNLHLEASADVPDGRTPRQVVDHLKSFVATELRRAKDGQEVRPPTGTFHRALEQVRTDEDEMDW